MGVHTAAVGGSNIESWLNQAPYKTGGNYKKLNLPFENKLLGQPAAVRERMVQRVEDFVYGMLTQVLNAGLTTATPGPVTIEYTTDPNPCRNELSDWLSARGRFREHIVLTEDDPSTRAAVDSYRAPFDESPEGQYGRLERLRLIQVAMDRLPARYGDVLEWKY